MLSSSSLLLQNVPCTTCDLLIVITHMSPTTSACNGASLLHYPSFRYNFQHHILPHCCSSECPSRARSCTSKSQLWAIALTYYLPVSPGSPLGPTLVSLLLRQTHCIDFWVWLSLYTLTRILSLCLTICLLFLIDCYLCVDFCGCHFETGSCSLARAGLGLTT